jgi:hypothetical protein
MSVTAAASGRRLRKLPSVTLGAILGRWAKDTAMFDSVSVQILVRDGDYVGMGSVVHEEIVELPLADEPLSLDRLFELAPAFFYEHLEMYDGYGVRVEGRAFSQGGDGSSAQVVLELVQGLTSVAYAGLGALFVKFLIDKLKPPRDDEAD